MFGLTYLMAAIPALFVVAIGQLIVHGRPAQAEARRLLLFLAAAGTALLAFNVLIDQIILRGQDSPLRLLPYLFLPTLVGVLALMVLGLGRWRELERRTQIWIALALAAQVILLFLLRDSQTGVGYLLLPGVAALAVIWGVGMRSRTLAVLLALAAVIGFLLQYPAILNSPPVVVGSVWIDLLFQWRLYVVPALAIALAAVLVMQALRLPAQPDARGRRLLQLLLLGLALVLPCLAAVVIFWTAVWDQADDGIGALAIAQLLGTVAIGAGMAMMLSLRGRAGLAGMAFLLVMPLLPLQAMALGMQASHHTITEERAARIAGALEQHRSRSGQYPAALVDLTPRELLFIEQPVLLPGEGWCYRGGADGYQLAAFYREFFSAPVSLRLYQSAGNPPPPAAGGCEDRLAAVQERFHSPMENPALYQPPQPTALPASALDFPKTPVEPLLAGARAVPGSWSPSGAHFFFGALAEDAAAEAVMHLYFLAGDSGELCTVPGAFAPVESLYKQHGWLPDGRVIYVDGQGKIILLAPCSDQGIDLSEHMPEPFTMIGAYAPETGRLLLQGDQSYWLLDGPASGAEPALRQIKGVAPNPYDLHWDTFAWLPGGEEVVISHLNGRDASGGSTLYLAAGDTGEVTKSLALELASDQSAPSVEALTGRQVILSSEGRLLLVDLDGDPPRVTDVVADIFDLDAEYPNEFAAAGWEADGDGQGYYIVLRLNHPRDKALYWLHAPAGAVEMMDSDLPALALMPDGQVWDMSPWQDKPSYDAKYAVLALPSGEIKEMVFDGHTPRVNARLHFELLPASEQLAVGSEQGVALHRLTDGIMEVFWELDRSGYGPDLFAASEARGVVASQPYGPLYWLPLP